MERKIPAADKFELLSNLIKLKACDFWRKRSNNSSIETRRAFTQERLDRDTAEKERWHTFYSQIIAKVHADKDSILRSLKIEFQDEEDEKRLQQSHYAFQSSLISQFKPTSTKSRITKISRLKQLNLTFTISWWYKRKRN